jgi:hypothetical protein
MEMDILRERLRNQHLVQSSVRTASEAVRSFGAVQAQDYAGARWAIGLRVRGLDDAGAQRAFNEGSILRLHILRPTWHFVAPADVRWLVALSGPRMKAVNARVFRRLELDPPTLARARKLIERTLRDGNYLTRQELASRLARAGISSTGQRAAFIMMCAEFDGVVCSGPVRGKQFTYALLDERVHGGPQRGREEALAELTRRYFTSHGPATARDFMWWSGLPSADVKRGIAMLGSDFEPVTLDGLSYWRSRLSRVVRIDSPLVHLLPNYDEYFVAYRQRATIVDPKHAFPLGQARIFPHVVAVDGRLRASWRRAVSPGGLAVEVVPYDRFTRAERDGVEAGAARYGAFLQEGVTVRWIRSGSA